jgi:uncharacterized protein DUF1194
MTQLTDQQHNAAWGGDADLALVIALDVSFSVSAQEFSLMRNGLAAALDTPEVEQALLSGRYGAMLICVVQWSGFQEQVVRIDWTRVTNRAGLGDVARNVRRMTRRYTGGATDIGGALNFCRKLILTAPLKSTRLVIDLAADGTNNVNNAPDKARDLAVAAGITINGLAITNTVFDLADYFVRFIIGGPGAFVEEAADYVDFERAMQKKLVRETELILS